VKTHNPAKSAQPSGPYSLGVEIPAGQRLLFVAGQVPVAADGSTPAGIKAQSEQVWRNILNAVSYTHLDVYKRQVFGDGVGRRRWPGR